MRCNFEEVTTTMARFNHIDGFYINAEQVLYIKEMSDVADGPKDSCTIYLANDKSIYLHRPAASVASLLSSK
jgi:hypothetical protein